MTGLSLSTTAPKSTPATAFQAGVIKQSVRPSGDMQAVPHISAIINNAATHFLFSCAYTKEWNPGSSANSMFNHFKNWKTTFQIFGPRNSPASSAWEYLFLHSLLLTDFLIQDPSGCEVASHCNSDLCLSDS